MGMLNSSSMSMYFHSVLLLWAGVIVLQLHPSTGQQTYVNNRQLQCEVNYTTALGYVCNGANSSCASYLTFRSDPPYTTPLSIASLLSSDSSEIARINNIATINTTIPTQQLVIVPLNCSCNGGPNHFYQHNASYVLQSTSETYFYIANNTYQGLSTCQSMISQNPYNYRNLSAGMRLTVPLRCSCPTLNQTAAGVNYLLSYLITWGDAITFVAQLFGVDVDSVYQANELTSANIVFPFTTVLVPLHSEPTMINTSLHQPATPPLPPQLPVVPGGGGGSSSHKWVFVGIGVGAGFVLLLLLSGFLLWFIRSRHRKQHQPQGQPQSPTGGLPGTNNFGEYGAVPEFNSWSVSSAGVRSTIESLTVYKFKDLQEATAFFGEANRIKGSVYKGSFKGDDAAVKIMKGDVSREINILKQINHSNIIRLSGFCVHEGNTYLVYEYAENGSLSDWIHLNEHPKTSTTTLSWKQRIQIAYDVAESINYLHHHINPPYIHKNLKSSNVLLDRNLRAKVANFGLARTLDDQNEEGGLHLTRHVVGTYGYMAPEYIENGLITPKLDVFAFGVLMLELLSGREATGCRKGEEKNGGEELLSATINKVLGGDNVRERLKGLIDPLLGEEGYPLELAYSVALLASNCVAHDLNSRPPMPQVCVTLSKILSSSLDWDPSDEFQHSRSLSYGR